MVLSHGRPKTIVPNKQYSHLEQFSIPTIIAVDGPAASGKGAIGRYLAEKLGISYLDTGSLYREVAARAISLGVDLTDQSSLVSIARRINPGMIDPSLIRLPQVTKATAMLATNPSVRKILRSVQRKFAAQGAGAVLDGRDIGTVVLPTADVKLFITARVDVRARRRYEELKSRGIDVTEEEVLVDLIARDIMDRERKLAPLKMAVDAIQVDTTEMSLDEAKELAWREVAAAIGRKIPD